MDRNSLARTMSIFEFSKENIDYEIFRAEELKEPEWNPLVYMQSLANSLYLLVARDFAPAEKRIPSLRQRLEKIPGAIAQAKANLQHPPRIHTETAIEQTQGAINLVRTELDASTRSGAANEEGPGPVAGQNRCSARGLQKMAPKRSAPPLGWRFRLGEENVQEETALRPGVGFADGRNPGNGQRPIWSGHKPRSTKRHCLFTKNIFRTPINKLSQTSIR